MSEKRFEVLFYGDVINCVKDETGKEYNLQELISILMEQQVTINKLNDELELTANTKLFSRRELERKVKEQEATINQQQFQLDMSQKVIKKLKNDIKMILDMTKEEQQELRCYFHIWCDMNE